MIFFFLSFLIFGGFGRRFGAESGMEMFARQGPPPPLLSKFRSDSYVYRGQSAYNFSDVKQKYSKSLFERVL